MSAEKRKANIASTRIARAFPSIPGRNVKWAMMAATKVPITATAAKVTG